MTNPPPELGRHDVLRGEQRAQARKQAQTRYQDGKSIDTIAAELGLAYGRTRALLIEAGETLRPHPGARLSGEQRAAMRDTAVARYAAGQTTGQIAADLRVTQRLILILLDEARVPRRPVQTGDPAAEVDAFTADLVDRYTAGASLTQLAAQVRRSVPTVRSRLVRAGATMRAPGRHKPAGAAGQVSREASDARAGGT